MNRLPTSTPFKFKIALITTGCLAVLAFALTGTSWGETSGNWGLRDADHYELRLPAVGNLDDWEKRSTEIREKLLISAGLWPLPEKYPLNARVFDEKSGDGFKVSKVYFESVPGFFATGNLYTPAKGAGPYPAILSPHGHWKFGRLQNGESGSIPGRCIDFARQGFVTLSLDMVGYNDSFQLPHDPNKSRAQLKADSPLPYEQNQFRADFDFPRARLYGFSLAGLQLWNSIRALDFLCSLPEVDPDRIGVTGASGGATQTILVMTADERVKVAAPVNIIGAQKHPGCRCENPVGLWIDTSTVEMSAAFAPRPLLLMSATEDPWTHSTPHREFPLIAKYYALYGSKENLANVHITAGHNYNAETRAAVYDWFCHHLNPGSTAVKHPVSVSPEVQSLGDLRVFPNKLLPENAISGWQVIKNWIIASEKAFQDSIPASAEEFPPFAQRFRHALGLAMSVESAELKQPSNGRRTHETRGDLSYQITLVTRPDSADRLELESIQRNEPIKGNVLLVYPREMGALTELDSKALQKIVDSLISKHSRIFRVLGYASGHDRVPGTVWEGFSWPDAYNRNNELRGVRDILLSLKYIAGTHPGEKIAVVGLGPCGLQTAFASALFGSAEQVVIDLNGRDPGYDNDLLELMPVGALKRVGDFRTAMLLLMQNKVELVNPGPTFDKSWYVKQAQNLGFDNNLAFRDNLPEALSYLPN